MYSQYSDEFYSYGYYQVSIFWPESLSVWFPKNPGYSAGYENILAGRGIPEEKKRNEPFLNSSVTGPRNQRGDRR